MYNWSTDEKSLGKSAEKREEVIDTYLQLLKEFRSQTRIRSFGILFSGEKDDALMYLGDRMKPGAVQTQPLAGFDLLIDLRTGTAGSLGSGATSTGPLDTCDRAAWMLEIRPGSSLADTLLLPT